MKSLGVVLSVMIAYSGSALAMDFAEAYQLALHNDSRLKASEQRRIGMQEEINKAQAGYYPKVQMGLSRGRGVTDTETGSVITSGRRIYDTQNYNLILKQPLFNKGVSADYSKAESSVASSNADYDAERFNLVTRLTERYLNALYAQDNFDYSSTRKTTLKNQLLQAQKRFNSGLGIKNDINEVQAELEIIEAKLIEDTNQLESTKRALEILTGQYPDKLARIDFKKIIARSAEDSRSIDDYLELAKNHNAEMEGLKQNVNAASSDYEKSKAGHYPTVDLQLVRSYTESESNVTIGSTFNTSAIAVQVNVPIYTGGYASASVRQSAAFIEEAKEKYNAKYKEISEKVIEAFNGMKNSASLIKAYENAQKANIEVVEGTKKAFLAGTRTNVDVIKAQDKLDETKLSYAKANYGYLLQRMQLAELTGQVGGNDIAYVQDFMMLNKADVSMLFNIEDAY